MRDDELNELMDATLTQAMAAPPPRPSSSFDDTVMRRVRSSRLSSGQRFVLWGYVLVAAAVSVVSLAPLPLAVIAGGVAGSALIAVGVTFYISYLTGLGRFSRRRRT